MILLYLLTGHFIADYILQPHSLVVWKKKSWVGVAAHAGIHFLVTSILLYIYISTVAVFVLALSAALLHFVIDIIKTNYENKHKHSVLVYWVDQVIHYISLVTLYFITNDCILSQSTPLSCAGVTAPIISLYTNPALLIFLSLSIFITLTVEYSSYSEKQKTFEKIPELNKVAMVLRFIFLCFLYIGVLFLFPAVCFTGTI